MLNFHFIFSELSRFEAKIQAQFQDSNPLGLRSSLGTLKWKYVAR